MIKPFARLIVLSTSLIALSACEAAKEDLGLSRRTPDEFAVVKRAPLEIPPDFYLRPPTPGAARPQEQTPADQAATTLLGNLPQQNVKAQSKAEMSILQKTNAAAADPTIRQTLNAETAAIAAQDKPTIQRILDIGGNTPGPAQVVDPAAEAARIKENKQSGQPIITGVTPSIQK